MFFTTIESRLGPVRNFIKQKEGEMRRVQDEFERDMVMYAYQRSRGNQSWAAKVLGMNRNTLRKLMAKHGITFDDLPLWAREDRKIYPK